MSRAFRFTLNATLFWIVASTFWYSCVLKDVCLPDPPADGVGWSLPDLPTPGAGATRVAPSVPSDKPLSFSWNAIEPVRGPGFDKFRSELLRQQPSGAVLEITGLHFAGERGSEIAIERARRVAVLFADRLGPDQIRIGTRTAERASAEQRGQFEAVTLRWTTRAAGPAAPAPPAAAPSAAAPSGAAPSAPAAAPAPAAGTQAAVGSGALLVYFPSGAGTQTLDPEMLAQLRALASDAARSGKTLVITGHTDSRGDEAANVALGLTRATTVRDYLAATVSPAPVMRVESEGPRQPIASNDSDEGRARNRRVEVVVQ